MGSDRTAAASLKRSASQRRPPTADCRSAMVSHGRRHAGLPDAGIAATDQAFNPVPVAVCQSALAASAAVVLPGVAITFTVAADQIGREFRQAIESPLRPTVFDGDVLSLDKPGFVQTLLKRGHMAHVGGSTVGESDYRHRWLLRASSERHCEDATLDAVNERSPVHHQITSSRMAIRRYYRPPA
jgi:hypothetical protein